MLIFFYIFGLSAVLCALGLIVLRSPVYCAMALVGTFVALAAIFVLLNSEFVAAMQILIYAGAIMVLFLFVIMLLNLRAETHKSMHWGLAKLLGVALAIGILAQLVGVLSSPAARLGPMGGYSAQRIADEGALHIVGRLLLTDYVLPFEIISVLLMVAVMGAVVLAKRRPPRHIQEAP